MALMAAGFVRTGRASSTNTNNAWGFGGAVTRLEEWAMDETSYWVGEKTLSYRHAPSTSFNYICRSSRGGDPALMRAITESEYNEAIANVVKR